MLSVCSESVLQPDPEQSEYSKAAKLQSLQSLQQHLGFSSPRGAHSSDSWPLRDGYGRT